MTFVRADQLTMTYRAPVRQPGLRAALASLVRRTYREVPALRGVSFELGSGELVGFIGPNGAGKTTTLKILAGVLHPTSGGAEVLGQVPWRRDPRLLRQIAMIRGSRPLGAPAELTVLDALRFQQLIYEVDEPQFRANLAELVELLELEPLLQRQVRALSLGERMRAGLAWSLIYRPRVLFLDEPTIGLDVGAVGLMRRFVADYCGQTGAAILLTSHYMADVETLCRRVILIDKGALVFDGELGALAARLAPYKLLKVSLAGEAPPDWADYGQVVQVEGPRVSLRVAREQAPATTARLLSRLPVADLAVVDPPLEDVIAHVYRAGVTA